MNRIYKSKKAQLSAFIIIAVLLLLIFGIGTYLFKLAGMSFEDKVDKAVSQTKKAANTNYIGVCLKNSVETSVGWIAKSGGYAGQIEKPYPDTAYAPLSMALTNLSIPTRNPPPEYPEFDFSIYRGTPYSFGKKHLPFLCQPGGPNDVIVGEYAYRCPAGAYGPNSIQQYMSLFVSEAMYQCIKPQVLNQTGEFKVEIEDSRPKVTIIFGEEGIFAVAAFPMTFEREGESATRSVEFTYEVPIRFKKIYGLADHLIRNDLYYVDFNISKDYKIRSADYDGAMKVIVEPVDPAGDWKTDIVHVIDNRSVLDGKAVDFRFARQNRPPVLEPTLKTSTIQDELDPPIPIVYDVAVQAGDPVKFGIRGADPDEDKMYFILFGWRMQYNATWNIFDINQWPPNCDSAITCTWFGLDIGWQDDLKRPKYVSSSNPSTWVRIGDTPQLLKDKWEIEIETDLYDFGGHNIFVFLGDDPILMQKLFDDMSTLTPSASFPTDLASIYQTYYHAIDFHSLNILVFVDTAQDPDTGCYFDDPAFCVDFSTEDPIVGDARSSIGTLFDWSIIPKAGDPEIILATDLTDPYTILPINYMDIDGIKTTLNLIAGETATLILGVAGDTKTIDKTVVECLDYKANTEYVSSPPWPYNKTDPYLSAHACCAGNVVVTDGRECFTETWIGPIYSFDKDKYTTIGPAPSSYTINWENLPGGLTIPGMSDWDLFPPSGFPDELLNDIYNRTVSRKCDGTRGNICTGPIVETITWLDDCGGDIDSNIDEACSGAKVSPGPYNAGCENYAPGITYEKKYDLIGDFGGIEARDSNPPTGGCDHDPDQPRATGNNGNFDEDGAWVCEKGCTGAGGCNVPTNCICDSDETETSDACDDMTYNDIAGKAVHKWITPANPAGVFCDKNCNEIDGDAFDSNAAACIQAFGGPPHGYGAKVWNPARPDGRECCGNNDNPSGDEGGWVVGHACCEDPVGCDLSEATGIPRCLKNNKNYTKNPVTHTLKSYLCERISSDDPNRVHTCTWANECEVKPITSNWYCSRRGWKKLTGGSSSSDGKNCGMEPPVVAGAASYCGKCQDGECTAKPSECTSPELNYCNPPMETYPLYQVRCWP